MKQEHVEAGAPVPIVEGIAGLASGYKVILSDVWGVVHNGKGHFPAACDALRRFREAGGVVVLITNAPRPSPPVLAQLRGLGVPDSTFDALVTSGDVTIAEIARRGLAPLHHIGPERDRALFEILRQQTGLNPPRVDLDEAEYVVCTGLFDDDHPLEHYDPALAQMRARRLTLISANPDIVVHVGDRELYCSGAIAERYAALGGEVVQAGKPFAPIYRRALELAGEKLGGPVSPREALAIGDGVHTDIRGAASQGIDAVFVTSGIHRAELHPAGPGAAGAANGAANALCADALARVLADHRVAPVAAMARLAW